MGGGIYTLSIALVGHPSRICPGKEAQARRVSGNERSHRILGEARVKIETLLVPSGIITESERLAEIERARARKSSEVPPLQETDR